MFDRVSNRYAWCTPEAFVELTPRMLHHFLEVIDRTLALDFFNHLAIAYKGPRLKELPSAKEFLGLLSNKPAEPINDFDPEVDAKLEAHAFKLLNERKAVQ